MRYWNDAKLVQKRLYRIKQYSNQNWKMQLLTIIIRVVYKTVIIKDENNG